MARFPEHNRDADAGKYQRGAGGKRKKASEEKKENFIYGREKIYRLYRPEKRESKMLQDSSRNERKINSGSFREGEGLRGYGKQFTHIQRETTSPNGECILRGKSMGSGGGINKKKKSHVERREIVTCDSSLGNRFRN